MKHGLKRVMAASVGLAALGFTLGAAATALAAEPTADPRAELKAFIAPGARTTNDPRRIPLPPRDTTNDPVTVLRGGWVFDAVQNSARPATVVIKGETIAAILPPASQDWPATAKVIDVTGKLVMPGLIDMHVHLTYPDPNTLIDEQTTEGDGVLRGVRNLRAFIESGFTTVRDLGGVADAPVQLSAWSAQAGAPTPRVFTAGHIITATGGHAAERPVSANHGPEYTWEVEGPDAWRRAVRLTYKQGASVIKIASHFSPEEVAAATDEAHALGLKITCHCETIYIKMAVDAGVDMIEHPLPRSMDTVKDMARRKTAAIPTLQVYQNVFDTGGYYGTTSRRFSMNSQMNFDLFKAMKAQGIVMGVGTDTIGRANGYIPNMYIAELKWFVKGGYTIPQALIAATRTNADLLDMGDRLGTLEAGKLADIAVFDGRPDLNLDDLSKIDLVIRGGDLIVQGGQIQTPRHKILPLPKPSPPEDTRE